MSLLKQKIKKKIRVYKKLRLAATTSTWLIWIIGLAAYGDSSSESGEEENNDDVNGGQVEHSVDSATKEARDKSDELSAEDLKVGYYIHFDLFYYILTIFFAKGSNS